MWYQLLLDACNNSATRPTETAQGRAARHVNRRLYADPKLTGSVGRCSFLMPLCSRIPSVHEFVIIDYIGMLRVIQHRPKEAHRNPTILNNVGGGGGDALRRHYRVYPDDAGGPRGFIDRSDRREQIGCPHLQQSIPGTRKPPPCDRSPVALRPEAVPLWPGRSDRRNQTRSSSRGAEC